MIDKRAASAQILRVSGLLNFPKEGPAIEELVNTLARAAQSITHASQIVQECLDSSRYAPTPHELRNYAAEIIPRKPAKRWNCDYCDGTGWRRRYELHTYADGKRKTVEVISREQYEALQCKVAGIGIQVAVEGTYRCLECHTGQEMAAAEAARQAEPEPTPRRRSR